MTLRFDPEAYCGGVMPEEVHLVEKFERELFPFLEKNGSRIGEAAVAGDLDAEAVILGYHRFINGLPVFRQQNFDMCVSALRRFEQKMSQ